MQEEDKGGGKSESSHKIQRGEKTEPFLLVEIPEVYYTKERMKERNETRGEETRLVERIRWRRIYLR